MEAGPHLNLFLLGFFDGLSSRPSISVTCRFPGELYSIVISKRTLQTFNSLLVTGEFLSFIKT